MHLFPRMLASTDFVFNIIINRMMPFSCMLLDNNIGGYIIVKQIVR